MSDADREIESKRVVRPLSWGEREARRRERHRARRTNRAERFWGRIHRKWRMMLRALGLTRRRIEINGVVYRERSSVSLRRALSATGPGVKEYDVRFPIRSQGLAGAQHAPRESMRIRYTHRRLYSDLGHDPRVRFVRFLTERVRPGQRVVELGCGTGGSGAMLASLVGPSGGVVAINRDGESIRYARQRYRADHLGFELGWIETLAGELDGSFDAVVAVDIFRDALDEPSKSRAISELWRALAPGGYVLLMCSDRNRLDEISGRLLALGCEGLVVLEEDPVLLWGGVIAQKPADVVANQDADLG